MKTLSTWTRQTLGGAVATGRRIFVWCNNAVCSYRQENGDPYRSVINVADLEGYAEKYGAGTTFEHFMKRLRCWHRGSGDISTIVDAPYVTPAEREARRYEV